MELPIQLCQCQLQYMVSYISVLVQLVIDFIIIVTPNNSVMLTVDGSGDFVGRSLYIEQGGDFEISCMAAGGPNNTHIWKQEGVTINSGSNFNISSSSNDTMSISILSVNSVDAAIHKGSYSCEVMNDAGEHFNGLIIHGI